MFRTIERKLVILTMLLVTAVAGSTWLLVAERLFWGLSLVCVAAWLLGRIFRGYKKFNSNVIFLLNALENGDYSFSFSEAAMTGEKRDVNSILNIIKEILVKARQAEIENEKFLSLIVAAIPVGIVIVDERDFVRVANDAALRLLGMHVFTHLRQLGMVDESILHTFRNIAPGRKATICITDEREERLISVSMSRIRILRGTLRVVSMHNIAGELEEREMESWIKLIRVMTHEIMNSIAPITSLSETMLLAYGGRNADSGFGDAEKSDSLDEAGKLHRNTVEAFATITSTARGLLSFVDSYRRFTGIPKPDPHPLALVPFVDKILGLEASLLDDRSIKVTTRFSDPAITVAADEGQIGQVFVNLLKNAMEAIPPGRTDGRIEVCIRCDGELVYIDVSNDGTPIPADVMPHIFVPFFTTKATGTGIGLSVSRYIMRLHGGNLKHHAEDGRTIFSMVFPVAAGATDPVPQR